MDSALNSVNKKTWDHTKPIMICNVLNFWSLISLGLCAYFGWNTFLGWCAAVNAFTSCLALHFCWELENKL